MARLRLCPIRAATACALVALMGACTLPEPTPSDRIDFSGRTPQFGAAVTANRVAGR